MRTCLVHRHSGRETREHREKIWTTALRYLFGRVSQRQPDVGRLPVRKTRMRELKARRHHTHHRIALIVERYLLVNDPAITAKLALPEAVAQNHCTLVVCGERSPGRGLRFEHRKEIGGNVRAANALGFRTRGKVETVIRVSSN